MIKNALQQTEASDITGSKGGWDRVSGSCENREVERDRGMNKVHKSENRWVNECVNECVSHEPSR